MTEVQKELPLSGDSVEPKTKKKAGRPKGTTKKSKTPKAAPVKKNKKGGGRPKGSKNKNALSKISSQKGIVQNFASIHDIVIALIRAIQDPNTQEIIKEILALIEYLKGNK